MRIITKNYLLQGKTMNNTDEIQKDLFKECAIFEYNPKWEIYSNEYLTNEDILKLTEGIVVYGKENLSSVLEDYE